MILPNSMGYKQERAKIERIKDKKPHIAVYKALDFHDFSGRVYIPALETTASRYTNKTGLDLPGFYLFLDKNSLAFIQPHLREVPLFVQKKKQNKKILLEL